MKNIIKLIGFIAFVTVIGFSFISCPNGSTDDGGSPKVVEARYRFTGSWNYGGTLTLGENTITTSTAGFSYSNVYTSNSVEWDNSGTICIWSYLYSGSVKIGTVLEIPYLSKITVDLGKSRCGGSMIPGLDSTDMQDDNNGYAEN